MGTWTYDQDGNWTEDKPEVDREDEARRDWERMKREELDWLRRHEPALQIVPVEQEKERPYVPTPDQIDEIIRDIDRPAPTKPTVPYLN